jgi:hypothetical protein
MRLRWIPPQWLAAARNCIDEPVAEGGFERTGELGQPRPPVSDVPRASTSRA